MKKEGNIKASHNHREWHDACGVGHRFKHQGFSIALTTLESYKLNR